MNKKQKEIYYWLMNNPGYLKKSVVAIGIIKQSWKGSDIKIALETAKKDHKNGVKVLNKTTQVVRDAMKVVSKEVRSPKAVRDGKVKKIVIEAVNSKPLDTSQADELITSITTKKVPKPKLKRLFFDIETSPNVLYSWRIGYNLSLDHNTIIKERAVICICYKWEGSAKVHSLTWDKGCDKQMLIKFMDIMAEADEVVGHNSDKFDIKWLRTRCLYNKIKKFPSYKSVDTYKLAKKYFNFNSNKLDYIGQFTGVGKKMDHGGIGLWKSIIEDNDQKSMDKMVKYCKVDVIRLSQIFSEMYSYCEPSTHLGVLAGHGRNSCPSCASTNTKKNGMDINAKGIKYQKYQCNSCGRNFKIPKTIADKLK